jgi:regulator of protease activity HflC (stomatin/prohibitin superfamily)
MYDLLMEHIVGIGVGVVFLGLFAWNLPKCFRIIPEGHIALMERRWWGKKLEPGQVFSTHGQIGIEAGFKVPGPRTVAFPVRRFIGTVPFTVIGPNEIGIVTANAGAPMPQGSIFAPDKAGDKHNDFQNAVAFLSEGGVVGKQLRTLNSGQRMINPKVFSVQKVAKTVIEDGHIGLITARDGEPLGAGQIVGRRVEGHDKFQKAEVFIANGGQKGPQVDFLLPGTWNINTEIFQVDIVKAIDVEDEEVGLVTALVGAPLGSDEVVAKTPDPDKHHNFQDGETFLEMGGKRGLQDSLLPPGRFYINTYMFEIKKDKATFIKQGEVGVVISYIGKDPAMEGIDAIGGGAQAASSTPAVEATGSDSKKAVIGTPSTDPMDKRLDSGVRTKHLVPRGYRGIQTDVLGPGKYYLNPRAVMILPVATTTCTMAWAAPKDGQSKDSSGLDPFKVSSKDAFDMTIEAECLYRIAPENAPFVISKVGDPKLLESQVIHPLVNGILRNQASGSDAIKYQQERTAEAKQAENQLRIALDAYKVEVVQLLITNIGMDKDLLENVKAKSKAGLQQQAYEAEQAAETTRIALESTRAQADQQKNLMAAKIGIDVAENQKQAMIKTAEGKAKSVEIEAEAQAKATKATGLAEAEVKEAIGNADGAAYRARAAAVTPEGLARIEIIERLAAHNMTLVPQTLIMSGNGEGGNNMGNMLTYLLSQNLHGASKPAETSAPAASAPAASETDATGHKPAGNDKTHS